MANAARLLVASCCLTTVAAAGLATSPLAGRVLPDNIALAIIAVANMLAAFAIPWRAMSKPEGGADG